MFKIFIIEQTKFGWFVLFQHGNQQFKGEIPQDYANLNINDTNYEKYTEIWAEYLNSSKTTDEIKEIKVELFFNELDNCKLLIKKENLYYRLNESVSLPQELAQEYFENQDNTEYIKSLDNFWYLCCLNDTEQREMIFSWIKRNKFEITKDGFLIGYRNVVNPIKFKDSVTELYQKLRKSKKSTNVNIDTDGKLNSNGELNLKTIYSNLDKIFTHDYYDRNKRLYYTLGTESTLNREETDFTNSSCSKGLHYGSENFIESVGQSYCGDTTVCVLINPSLIASCPDNYDKGRSIALYFVDVVKWNNNKVVPLSKDVIDIHSTNYAKTCQIDLDNFVSQAILDIHPKYIGRSVTKTREILNLN